jgi:hypothetical protein
MNYRLLEFGSINCVRHCRKHTKVCNLTILYLDSVIKTSHGHKNKSWSNKQCPLVTCVYDFYWLHKFISKNIFYIISLFEKVWRSVLVADFQSFILHMSQEETKINRRFTGAFVVHQVNKIYWTWTYPSSEPFIL